MTEIDTTLEENKTDSSEVLQPNGVLVHKLPTTAPGEYRIEIQELGELDPLAVPTLLKLAAKLKEQNLGI